jgi:hypothetical protein
MDPKLLTEMGWKATAEKCKVKDNGLQRALSAYEKLDDDEHEDRLKGIASLKQLAGALKKSKEVAAAPGAGKYLADLISAAESEQREITKAKVLAEKAQALEDEDSQTLDAMVKNGFSKDIFLTISDLNKGSDQVIVDRKRLNEKRSIAITLEADSSGLGKIHWVAEPSDGPVGTIKEDTEKGIKKGATITLWGAL